MRDVLPRWLGALVAGVYLFLHLPVLIVAVFSVNASRFSVEWTGFTLEWYRRLFERPDLLAGLRNSVVVGLAATAIATVAGTLLALALSRHRFRGRAALEGALYVPLVTPEVVIGVALLGFFAWLKVGLGLATIVIAHVVFCVAFVTIVVQARLAGMGRSLEEAALLLGADELTAFRRVTLPILLPAIAAGGLLAFTISFDDYIITSFVAGPGSSTLPIVVYGMVRRTVEPTVNAISTLVLIVTSLLIYLADRFGRRKTT